MRDAWDALGSLDNHRLSCWAVLLINSLVPPFFPQVRVWGLHPLRLVALHQCHHSPLAVALDPWGAEMVVCYADCVRVYSVVEGMLMEVGGLYAPPPTPAEIAKQQAAGPGANNRQSLAGGAASTGASTQPTGRHSGAKALAAAAQQKEMPKCSAVAYSPTGHLLAVVGGEGNRDVIIYSSLHRSVLARLTGHWAPVQDLCWSADGLYLATVSEGAVYTWHMDGFKRSQENTVKTMVNNSVGVTPDFATLVVGDPAHGIRILDTFRAPPVSLKGNTGPIKYTDGLDDPPGGLTPEASFTPFVVGKPNASPLRGASGWGKALKGGAAASSDAGSEAGHEQTKDKKKTMLQVSFPRVGFEEGGEAWSGD